MSVVRVYMLHVMQFDMKELLFGSRKLLNHQYIYHVKQRVITCIIDKMKYVLGNLVIHVILFEELVWSLSLGYFVKY